MGEGIDIQTRQKNKLISCKILYVVHLVIYFSSILYCNTVKYYTQYVFLSI